MAAEGGYKAVAQLLLEKGADVNTENRYRETALHLTARYGLEAVAQLLLENGADANAKDNWNRTAADVAAEGGHSEALVQLLTPLSPISPSP